MANTHATLSSLFSAIANAIRSKTGSTAKIIADDFPDAIAGISASGDGIASASGRVTLDASCENFNIETGLSSVDTVIVVRTAVPSGASGTWGWQNSGAGSMTNCLSYGSTISFQYGHKVSRLTKNDDGSVTVNQYSTSYPILAGTYNWIAYGSK